MNVNEFHAAREPGDRVGHTQLQRLLAVFCLAPPKHSPDVALHHSCHELRPGVRGVLIVGHC